MKKIICLLVLLLWAGGCATTAKYEAKLNTWIGASEASLIAVWGVPDKSYALQDGRKALAFVRRDSFQTGGYTYTKPQVSYQTGTIGNETYRGTTTTYVEETEPVRIQKLFCKTSFIIGSDGRVESWSHEGNNCVSP